MKIVLRVTLSVGGAAHHAWCPALPGCSASGGRRGQVLSCLEEHVRGCLASLDVVVVPPDIDEMFQVDLHAIPA